MLGVVKEIQKQINEGRFIREIAQDLHRSEGYVYKIMREYGIQSRKFPRGVTEVLINEVVAYTKAHPKHTQAQIRKQFGLSEYKIKWIMQYAQIDKRSLRQCVEEVTPLQHQILQMYATNKFTSQNALAKELGISRAYVSKTLRTFKEG